MLPVRTHGRLDTETEGGEVQSVNGLLLHLPRVVSCRGHRRCTPALPLRSVAKGWWWWCDSWCRTGRPSSRQTAANKQCHALKKMAICSGGTPQVNSSTAVTHQPPLRFDERSVDAVHLVVQSAGVAQVVACPISPPQGGRHRPAVHTLSPLGEVIEKV